MKNDNLNDLLKMWDPAVPEPADFQRTVWRRIETSSAAASPSLGEWFQGMLIALARPQIAVAAVALALLAGVWAGGAAGPDGRMVYLRSVNPYAQGEH